MNIEEFVHAVMNALMETPQWKWIDAQMQADVPQSPHQPPAATAQMSKRRYAAQAPATSTAAGIIKAPKQPQAGDFKKMAGDSHASKPHYGDEDERFLALMPTSELAQEIHRKAIIQFQRTELAAGRYPTHSQCVEHVARNWKKILQENLESLKLNALEGRLDNVAAAYSREKSVRVSDRHAKVMQYQKSMHKAGRYLSYDQAAAAIG
jgi:hypothetical protein